MSDQAAYIQKLERRIHKQRCMLRMDWKIQEDRDRNRKVWKAPYRDIVRRLFRENQELRAWKAQVEAQAEGATEFVLAQIVADLKHDLERSMTAHTEQVQENERLRKRVEEYEALEEFRAELEFRD